MLVCQICNELTIFLMWVLHCLKACAIVNKSLQFKLGYCSNVVPNVCTNYLYPSYHNISSEKIQKNYIRHSNLWYIPESATIVLVGSNQKYLTKCNTLIWL
jgi:hypothetical protein